MYISSLREKQKIFNSGLKPDLGLWCPEIPHQSILSVAANMQM